MTKDNRSYYDEFSTWYDRERGGGYHALIDHLELDLVREACLGKDVLEVGVGTGLLLSRVSEAARSSMGIDLSAGMLERAVARGLTGMQAMAESLPLEAESFDVVFCFKVLAHIKAIEAALREMARVTRPGGRLFLEFYNKYSMRHLVKELARPGAISQETTESAVFTRYDTPRRAISYLPDNLVVVRTAGVRVFTPMAGAHRVPIVRDVLRRAEWWARDSFARHLGGFYVIEALKMR